MLVLDCHLGHHTAWVLNMHYCNLLFCLGSPASGALNENSIPDDTLIVRIKRNLMVTQNSIEYALCFGLWLLEEVVVFPSYIDD